MSTRNNLRKLARETRAFLGLFIAIIAIIGGTLLCNTNEQAEAFITVAHDEQERFVNGENVLIKRVHEEHWNIFYTFDKDCPDSRKTEENHRILREELETVIRMWLAPLREITDRPIVDKFVFYKANENNAYLLEDGSQIKHAITANFTCKTGRSVATRGGRYIKMRERDGGNSPAFGNLPYAQHVLLHEMGHAFDLADTYVSNPNFSPPSSGLTIGNQPKSVMSGSSCGLRGILCLDDRRAVQWLYRYHWEGLDPTNCPPEFVYEELTHDNKTVGGCVFRQPLITELRQQHLSRAKYVLEFHKNIKINDKDKHGLTALHYLAPLHLKYDSGVRRFVKKILDYPDIDINITDNYGNSPLHWATWFGNYIVTWTLLFLDDVDGVFPERKEFKVNAQNKYGRTALHNAAELGRESVTVLLLRTDLDLNIKESRFGNTPLHEAAKNGHTEIVKMLLAHKDINPNRRNDAGFTPLQLAMQGGAVAAADSDAGFQEAYQVLLLPYASPWSAEKLENVLESPRLSPAELQRARAEIITLLRAHPGIILPEASDVNGDGIVNILDLVKVSNAFGQRGQVPEDVNGDGVVNIQDLVWVSGAFGQ